MDQFPPMKDLAHTNLGPQQFRPSTQDESRIELVIEIEKGKLIDCNPFGLRFFQLSRKALLAHRFSELVDSPQLVVQIIDHLENALDGGNPVFRCIFKNGQDQEVPCEVRLFRFPPYDQKLVKAIISDISKQKEIEFELERIEEAFCNQKQLLEYVSDAILSIDKDFKILSWNGAAESLYGWSSKEVIGKSLRELIVLKYLHTTRENAITEFSNKGTWRGEVITETKTGQQIFVHAMVTALQDVDGNPIGAIAIHRDITDRKKAEIALNDSEKKFRKAFYNNANMMILAEIETLTMLDVNESYCEKLGFTREEVLHIPGMFGFNVSDPEIKTKALEVLQTKGQISNHEVTLLTKSNEEVHVLVSIEPLKIEGKNLHNCTCVDITDRRLAEKKLRSAQQELLILTKRLQLSNQAAQVGIWDWNMITDEIIWDEIMFKLYGRKKDEIEVTGEIWEGMTHPDDITEGKQKLEEAKKGKNEIQVLSRITWPDQSAHFLKIMGIIQRDEAGNPTRMIGTTWDVTKEKEIERQKILTGQLRARNKELEQFTYIASHDMKEPLRTVISFISLLNKRYKDTFDEDAGQYLNFISEAAYRMDKLVKGLLEYSRIGMNQRLGVVDCNAIIRTVLNDLGVLISEADATITVSHLPEVNGYSTEFRVLCQNLISNAIKFKKADSAVQINISAQRKENLWEFCFADDGIGIDPQYWTKIFTIFQRLHTIDKYKGTGIGLAHCQKIVDLHGGNIWVESQADKGSSFYFTIPIINPEVE